VRRAGAVQVRLRGWTRPTVHTLAIADPWLALVTFFERTAARQAADRGLYQTLTGQGDPEEQARIWPEIVASVTELFERGKRSGVIRPDAAPQDVAAIFAMLGVAYEKKTASTPELWRRYLTLVLDGLRATDRPELPVPPPSLDALDVILAAGKRHLQQLSDAPPGDVPRTAGDQHPLGHGLQLPDHCGDRLSASSPGGRPASPCD